MIPDIQSAGHTQGSNMKSIGFSVSVRCLPLARLGACLREAESGGAVEWKIDVCDGTFAPGFALGFETLEAIRDASPLPIHVHALIERPERYISEFARLGCKALTVPIEACTHAHRMFAQIREAGIQAGASINPGTALTKLEYVLPMLDRVVLPVTETGAAEVPRAAFERVRILRENLDYHRTGASVCVEGGLGAIDAARLVASGANHVVIDRLDMLRIEPLDASIRSYIGEVQRVRRTA